MHGPADLWIERPVPAGYDDPEGITFAESAKYLVAAEASTVAAVVVGPNESDCTKPHIRCRAPREAFGRILALAWRDLPAEEGVHATAVVAGDAHVEEGASVGPFCVVGSGARIAAGARVYPFCYVGEECRIATGARLYPHVTLYRDVRIGERTIVHSGAVLGADGFGYFWDGERHRKIPQVGGVRIGDDCEIGALTAVDRATAGETRIADGVKIDNLVQVAHNVEIGSHTVIAAQTGIGGSSRIGSRVTLAGQVGVADHMTVSDDVVLGGQTGITRDIEKPGEYWGTPARDTREQLRLIILTGRLPQLMERLRNLEQEVEALRARANED